MATLQIPADLVAAASKEMRDVTFATTASGSVLGATNDYAIFIEAAIHHEFGMGLHGLSVKLADTPRRPARF